MNIPLPIRAYLRLVAYRVSACICPVILASWLLWDLISVPVRSQLEECE